MLVGDEYPSTHTFSVTSVTLYNASFIASLGAIPSVSGGGVTLSVLLGPGSCLFLGVSAVSAVS